MADKQAFKRYVNAQAGASLKAKDELAKWFDNVPDELISDPVAFRNALIEVYTNIAYKYSLLSAYAAAEFYKKERDAALGGDYEPYVSDTINPKQLEKQVRYAMRHFVFPQDVINGM